MTAADLTEVAPQQRSHELHRVVIEPHHGWRGIGLRELWRFRELVRALAGRDIKIRYKQTLLGFLWAVLQPFMLMVVFTFMLHGVGNVAGDPGLPYPIFSFSGLVLWQYFSDSVSRSAISLVSNNVLVSKVYFPRLAAPLSGIVAPMLDFVIAFVMLLGMMLWYGIAPTHLMPWAILFLLMTAITAMAFGVWLAALNVEFRDVGYAIPLLMQLWMFAGPVAFSASNVSGVRKWVFALNPMGGILLGFRRAMLGKGPFEWWMVGVGFSISVVMLVTGLLYFNRVERTFADAI